MSSLLNRCLSEDLLQLHRLLQCELSAIEAYALAIEKIRISSGPTLSGLDEEALTIIRREHEEAGRWIRKEIEERGGVVSGYAMMSRKARSLGFVPKMAGEETKVWADLSLLTQEEENSIGLYQDFLEQEELDERIEELVRAFLLPTVQHHLVTLKRYIN